MNWIAVDTTEELKRLDSAVCSADFETIEFYSTAQNEKFFPGDISRSGYVLEREP